MLEEEPIIEPAAQPLEARALSEVTLENGQVYYFMIDSAGQTSYLLKTEELPLEIGQERGFDPPKRGIWTSAGPEGQTNPEADIIGIVQHENGEVYFHMRGAEEDDEGNINIVEYYAPQSEVREATEEDQPLKPGVERTFTTPKRGIWISGGPEGQENPAAEILSEVLHEDGQVYYKMCDPEGQVYYAPKREVHLLGDQTETADAASGAEADDGSHGTSGSGAETQDGTLTNTEGEENLLEKPRTPVHDFWEKTKQRYESLDSRKKKAAVVTGAILLTTVFGGVSIPAAAVAKIGWEIENARMRRYEEQLGKQNTVPEESSTPDSDAEEPADRGNEAPTEPGPAEGGEKTPDTYEEWLAKAKAEHQAWTDGLKTFKKTGQVPTILNPNRLPSEEWHQRASKELKWWIDVLTADTGEIPHQPNGEPITWPWD